MTNVLSGSEQSSKSSAKFLEEKLFKSRAVTIFGEINDTIARTTTERLLALAGESDEPITLYISSPGGHVESGDVVYDIIKFIKPVVRVVGTGWVASAATNIYLAAKKEHRFALPNTRFLVHQPSGGSRGRASDIKIQAEQIVKMRERINRLIADETGQPYERVAKDTDRDYWMTVEEAIDYGIVGKCIRQFNELG
ncbi:ATP-dependent Clp protease proteolytic subunit [Pseudohongiella nitratireducens]|uniref:ATP-dependent Clp protease proteolytic subunit n=1 Tax=Pseudohongiella nitratireducens TaxID=1768907 RepID=A0A916VJH3_9GAMM|nr:ATP-dependent Clp protease proteolytic subunit [Pseudohongiella nitratireducens]MDF1624106.1 ATP-dependent Clp protease proteolytic subunit [Pseudohongiella nitratireducens]GFZ75801.1 ATP-dependent Clp protease proteolytic subunit [Pseudohongiella nitratireducens]|tara:strand:- start:11974 stop:12561 length:588 start_codon:yes stop_codon:yes gene_type:complete